MAETIVATGFPKDADAQPPGGRLCAFHEGKALFEYRSFRNPDPPQILKLWEDCGLGRGAAKGFSCDALEFLVFGQPYFDPHGLIVARSGKKVVGYVHAGFGKNAAEGGVSHEAGVICAVMVHPDFRRRGIGRSLVSAAESYLRDAGSVQILAGQSSPRDGFYLGLYGGAELPGFLESDVNAAPFFQSLGYQPRERRLIFQRDISAKQEPFDARLPAIRRAMQLGVTDKPEQLTLWWVARYGRFDAFRFLLMPKNNGPAIGDVTCFGLDLYLKSWQQRCVGLTGLTILESVRRKGNAKALVLEVFRRLREEMVTRVEMQAVETNTAAVSLLQALRFEQVDAGITYEKP